MIHFDEQDILKELEELAEGSASIDDVRQEFNDLSNFIETDLGIIIDENFINAVGDGTVPETLAVSEWLFLKGVIDRWEKDHEHSTDSS